ncbi:unnamed protein product [Phytomonas sp. EM1]|nr:unnamed protein product [Phytomonas sp. EM1]|eukprot:CCW62779.1 unnamed protein product [Phytomonas sp. isolate EM1]
MSASGALNSEDVMGDFSYHCVLYDIPFDLAVSLIAEHVIPSAESEFVKELEALHVKLISRQLRIYKESLDSKFGFIDYEILSTDQLEMPKKLKLHRLVIDWIHQDLMSSLQSVGCKVRIAQPLHCCSSKKFLDSLDKHCKITTPEYTEDPQKIKTFILSRVNFLKREKCDASSAKAESSCQTLNEASQCEAETGEAVVATFSVSSLTAKEIIWLKRSLLQFPPFLVANGDLSTAHADQILLLKFFQQALAPIIGVCVSSVSDTVEIGKGDK